jgi:type I restriction enzyme S subunit
VSRSPEAVSCLDRLRANPDWSSLPLFDRSNWTRVRFGDVVKQLKEEVNPASGEVDRYVAGEHMQTENIHIRAWGNVGEGYLGPAFVRRFRKGQVLYGSRRTYLKKVAVAQWDGVTANTTFVLEAVGGRLLQQLLPWLMLSERFTKHSIKESKGSTNPYINFPDIAKFEFDLPPLDQQQRIAEIHWALDKVVESYEANAGAVSEAITARLAREFGSARNSALTRMPLSEVAFLQTGIAKGKMYSESTPTIELPYLRVANVQDGYIDLTEMKTLIVPKTEQDRYKVRDGDVVICEGGDFDQVGRGAIWRGQIPDCLHQNHVFCLRANRSRLLPEFLALELGSPYGKKYFLGCAKKTSNLASINSTQVKAFPFQLPELAEQCRVVREVEQLQAAKDAMLAQAYATRHISKALIGILL